MKTIIETKKYQKLLRVRDFTASHNDLFSTGTLGSRMVAIVTWAASTLAAHAASQVAAIAEMRQGSIGRAEARIALIDTLQAISRTARAAALDIPGLAGKFSMPLGRSDQALLAAALAMHRNAEEFVPVFVKHDMPEEFRESLNRCIRNLQRAMADRQTAVQRHNASKGKVRTAMAKGRDAVQRLDAIVRNKLQGDPITLEVWARASANDRAARSKPEPELTPVPAPAPA